jgi:hypothetical protein
MFRSCPAVETVATRAPSPPAWAPRPTSGQSAQADPSTGLGTGFVLFVGANLFAGLSPAFIDSL